jgi:hypothetical protein
MKTIAYHFVADKLRDGRAIPPDGEWLEHIGKIEMCEAGLHASLHIADALKYAPGATLCLVELSGEIQTGDDKIVASRRRILARFDATELLRKDARDSALSVIHLWDAPAVVKQYLETGDASLRAEARQAARAACAAYAAYAAYAAAADAADAAAYAAADAADAAYAATYAAADAAYAAHRDRLQKAVAAKFAEMGVKLP